MNKLVVVDLGTFCDYRLMDDALRELQQQYDIVYVTDEKRKLPADAIAYRFKTPTSVTGTSNNAAADIDLNVMDADSNVILWGVIHPMTAYEAYTWISAMRAHVEAAVRDHGAVGIILHYAATMMLWNLAEDLLKRLQIFVIYHAPGLVNKSTPWVFDPVLKSADFTLYESGKRYEDRCMKSWYAYYDKLRVSVTTSVTSQHLRGKLGGNVHHIMCWDQAVARPLEPAFKALRVHQAGALYNERYAAKRWYGGGGGGGGGGQPKWIRAWLAGAPTVLVSFGSYSVTSNIQRILPLMLGTLEECGVRVLYHATSDEAAAAVKDTAHRRVIKGWLPYEWAVPKCAAVLFTGSVCLQSVCIYNKTPMIFVPLLAEQFFWARNYEAMTGTPFVHYQSADHRIVANLLRAWLVERTSPMTTAYLRECGKSMRLNDGSKRIGEIVRAFVAPMK